jgi:hypothetical protein
MSNVSFNIDVKKLFEDCVVKNIRKPIYLIRILNHKDMLSRLCDNILSEKTINYHALTFPGMIWDHKPHDLSELINILNKYCRVIDSDKITISNFIFITSNNIDFIEKINNKQHIYFMTNSQTINKYEKEKFTLINYDDYLVNDVLSIEKEIEIYNARNFYKTDKRVFLQLNKIIEALNKENLNFLCMPYALPTRRDREDNIPRNEQFVLFFDCI